MTRQATRPRVLCAPDKFRGTADARAVAEALAAGARAAGWAAEALPLADGGEGTLDALGGATRRTPVTGPLGEPVEAAWRLDGADAAIETAAASGLALAGGRERNHPVRATSAGTGELIAAALRAGARRIVVALGGSAMTDGGAGAVDALLADPAVRDALAAAELIVATDVRTPFLDAARVFGPQKGASPAQVDELTARLERVARRYRDELGVDVAAVPGAGAAGGLGGGLHALGGRIVDGFSHVADAVGLDARLAAAEAVITGEGCLDATSFEGKVVGGVLARARVHGVPAGVVAGRIEHHPVGVPAISLVERAGERRALEDTRGCLREAAPAVLAALGPGAA